MSVTISHAVEIKQPLFFVDGSDFNTVAGSNSAVHAVDTWDDISEDSAERKGFSHSQGINGFGPTALVASPGKLTNYLNNSAQNSASTAGYYSLDHASKRFGFEQAVPIRVKYTYDGSDAYKWRGRIYDPDPSPMTIKDPFTKLISYDWMKEAQDHNFQAIVTDTNQRGDQAITTLLGILPNSKKPQANTLATGKSIFPYVFNSERDESTAVLTVLQKIAQSEQGRVYVNHQAGNGENLVFENRHHASTETDVQYDFDDDVVEVETAYPFKLIKTRVITLAHPSEIDAANVVLGQIQKSFQVPANSTKPVTLNFRDPVTGNRNTALPPLAARVSGTDYIAHANEDGSGAVRTADLTVTENKQSSNTITLDCENTSATAFWVTILQQKGKGINLNDPLTYEVIANSTEIAEKGEHVLRYDLPYEDDYNVAKDFGDYLLSAWKEPICQIRGLTYYPQKSAALAQAFMDIDNGKRITVNFTQLGIDQDYFVTKITVVLDRGEIKCSYNVTPADAAKYKILNDAVNASLGNDACRCAF